MHRDEYTIDEFTSLYQQQPSTFASSGTVSSIQSAPADTKQPDTSFADLPGNIIPSAVSTAKNVGSALLNVFNPNPDENTLVNLGKTAVGGVQKLIPGKQAQEENFDALTGFFKERYGSLDALKETVINDPVGFALDVSTVATGGAGVARGASRTATRAGATTAAETLTRGADTLADVARTTDPLVQAGRGASAVSRRLNIGGKLDQAAVSQMQKALNLNPSDIRRIQKKTVAGKSPEEWVLERGFTGSQVRIADDLDEYARGTKAQVDDGLAGIQQTFTGDDIVPARQAVEVLEEAFEGTVGNDDLLTRLKTLNEQEALTLTDMNGIKRLIDTELDLRRVSGDLKAGAKVRGLNNIRSQLQRQIEELAKRNGFADVKALNKETQVAREIEKSLRKRLEVKGTNLEFGLRDAILGVGGFAVGDLGLGIGAVAARKLLESSRFRTFLAQKLRQMTPEQRTALQNAVKNRNYDAIRRFTVTLVNDFSQAQGPEDQLPE